MTKTRKGVGDRRLAEPCFAMQNAPRSGRTRRGGRWGKESFLPPKGAAPEHRARRRGSARKSDAQTMLGASSPSENARGGCRGWPCLLGRWTSHKRMPGLFCTPGANRLIYPLYEPITKSLEPFAATKWTATPRSLPDPSATPRKKERKACLSAGMAKTAGSAGRLDARRPRRAGAESSRRSSAPLARVGMVLISSFC